ncbi:DUF4381 domain-containing protein [Aeromonas veronii]|uniref:DUF4381 domain-containing protein n=1 Tax=Aeromonas TaxID=642 RepID=UPI00071848EF|nr:MULTISPECIES: DUF4381 domain-containing protein [Aeromonas]HDN9000745.1 DUF4381 domain-containing protein [Aeromonas veronii AMC24]KRV94216.1 hypothetical protein AO718_02050 [Aeromonas veronii]KRV96543.1 hypothetical protein AO725_06380 [Aeromonas veronii]KRW05978.1 hypothetical protein AO745_09390 [Aeromonas veronii]KRW14885.1 hypothetical protein AO722_08050 [Aeromonas veronii]
MSSGMSSPTDVDIASPASDAITPPLAALMRDIHPGPDLIEQSLDPRVQALLWLLITGLLLLLIILIARRVIRYRRWCRQLEGDPALLVARIQEALRHEALQRWPEARQLQGEAWLAFVDRHGGSDFSQFSSHWSSWLYGSQNPTREQSEQLRQHYRRWGQTLFLQRSPRSKRKAARRHP